MASTLKFKSTYSISSQYYYIKKDSYYVIEDLLNNCYCFPYNNVIHTDKFVEHTDDDFPDSVLMVFSVEIDLDLSLYRVSRLVASFLSDNAILPF